MSKDAKTACKVHSVQFAQHSIIYSLLDDVRKRLGALLGKETKITVVGEAEVLQVFKIKYCLFSLVGVSLSKATWY